LTYKRINTKLGTLGLKMKEVLQNNVYKRSLKTLGSQAKLSNNVYKLRAKSEITQEQLAQKVGVTRQTIIAIEKGNYAPSVTLAIKLAKVLKTEVKHLFKIKYER
jgi:putative transcriptional regulator